MASRIIVALVIASGFLAQAPVHPQEVPAPWPPPGVLVAGDVDSPPAAIKRVTPAYTGDAVRARISGVVMMECVVQADGTVGDVRVVKSLDALHGLDEAAIAALKQWQFKPATKDGKAVPVLARAELTFTLRKEPSTPSFTWPQEFENAIGVSAWNTDDFDAGDLRFHIEYPEGWSLRRDPAPGALMEVTNLALSARLRIATPAPTPVSFERPFEPEKLKAIAERMQAFAAATRSMTPQSRGFGQTPAGGRIWVWTEWYVRTDDQKGLPDDFRALASTVIEGTSAWTFQTAAAGQAINVVCMVMLPAGTTTDEQLQQRNQAAAQLGAILRRLTIKTKQP